MKFTVTEEDLTEAEHAMLNLESKTHNHILVKALQRQGFPIRYIFTKGYGPDIYREYFAMDTDYNKWKFDAHGDRIGWLFSMIYYKELAAQLPATVEITEVERENDSDG